MTREKNISIYSLSYYLVDVKSIMLMCITESKKEGSSFLERMIAFLKATYMHSACKGTSTDVNSRIA